MTGFTQNPDATGTQADTKFLVFSFFWDTYFHVFTLLGTDALPDGLTKSGRYALASSPIVTHIKFV
jgi:hypothetical protein